MQDDLARRRHAGLEYLKRVFGPKGLLSTPEDCQRYAADQSGLAGEAPLAVVRPATTEEVARALEICNGHNLTVIPQGGRTGLSGGACGLARSVVLSSERLTGIIELDRQAMTLTAWAGTPLETVQMAARDAGFEYPVDIGSRGSATIGGTIATNAGGIRVLQHGMTRQNVLGLEAVLADGSVISRLGKTVKDNSGFDLKHVFIGSEGTLGVITRAVLQLRPSVPHSALALLALPDHAAALACLAAARTRFGTRVAAFEGMWPDYWDFVCHQTQLVTSPFKDRHGFYLLLEVVSGEDDAGEQMEAFFAERFEAGEVIDGILAKSVAEMQALWAIREAVGEVDADLGPHINFDIGLAPSDLGRFCDAVDGPLAALDCAGQTLKVGHVGDGNAHLLVAHEGSKEAEERIEETVYSLLSSWGGAVTAEHGIGRIKVRWLDKSRSKSEMQLMQTMKTALDPQNILSPGVLFAMT
jgi:FAD/FMN-containing dehydrogenase